MKNIEKENKKKYFKKTKLFASLIAICILSLSIIQIIVTNHGISSGDNVTKLEEEKDRLLEENDKLETQIAKFTSIKNIKEQAKKIGFIEASSIVYLSTPLPVALNTR